MNRVCTLDNYDNFAVFILLRSVTTEQTKCHPCMSLVHARIYIIRCLHMYYSHEIRSTKACTSKFRLVGSYSATSSPNLTEAGTSVRLPFQSRSLLLLADESSGVTVRMKLFRDFNLLAAAR